MWLAPNKVSEDGLVYVGTTSDIGLGDQGPAALVNGLPLPLLDHNRLDLIAGLIRNGKPLADWPSMLFEVAPNVRRGDVLLAEPYEPGSAIRIMTGAVIPPGADTVVRFEETSEAVTQKATGKGSDVVEILSGPERGTNVRHAGEDIHKDQVVLRRGTILRPPEIGLLASIGQSQVPVHRRPRVAILATGDELVGIDEPLPPGKIRNSNEYANTAAVLKAGGQRDHGDAGHDAGPDERNLDDQRRPLHRHARGNQSRHRSARPARRAAGAG